MRGQCQQAERQFVVREIEALVADADYMAALVARFLKNEGFPAAQSSAGKVDTWHDSESPVVRGWKAYLLNLATAIRFAIWERSGLLSEIPEDLPAAAVVLRNAIPSEEGVRGEDWCPEPFKQTRRVWQCHMVHHNRRHIDADVVLKPEVATDELVGTLVEFLWRHRHLTFGGEDNAGATEE